MGTDTDDVLNRLPAERQARIMAIAQKKIEAMAATSTTVLAPKNSSLADIKRASGTMQARQKTAKLP